MVFLLYFSAASRDLLQPWLVGEWPWQIEPAAPAASVREEPLPVPRSAEIALSKARALYAAGHLTDALRTVEGINAADPLFIDGERLRGEIQRALLSSVSRQISAPDGAPVPQATTFGSPPSSSRE